MERIYFSGSLYVLDQSSDLNSGIDSSVAGGRLTAAAEHGVRKKTEPQMSEM